MIVSVLNFLLLVYTFRLIPLQSRALKVLGSDLKIAVIFEVVRANEFNA